MPQFIGDPAHKQLLKLVHLMNLLFNKNLRKRWSVQFYRCKDICPVSMNNKEDSGNKLRQRLQ